MLFRSNNAKVSINGGYFAAYNNETPYPDGIIIKDGMAQHLTDIGCTLGFTKDNQVLIDITTTRVKGYRNGEEAFLCYRVNRPSNADYSTTVMYTPMYGSKITLASTHTAVVVEKEKVTKKVTGSVSVPSNGIVLVMNHERAAKYKVGDRVTYELVITPKNTSVSDWWYVTEAMSAGPSLRINGVTTPNPVNEKFTEAKILTQVAQRTFIGVTADNQVMVGTATASVSQLKKIVVQLGLESAMCLDGGASSALYYYWRYLTGPGRLFNNSVSFTYQ